MFLLINKIFMGTYRTWDSAPESWEYTWVWMENDDSKKAPSENMKNLKLNKWDPFPPVQWEDGKWVWENDR